MSLVVPWRTTWVTSAISVICPTLLDEENGTEKPYPSVRALLDEWVADELRDVLLLPALH